MQGAAPPSPLNLGLGRAGLGGCQFWRDRDKCVQCGIEPFDSGEARVGQLDRRNFSPTHQLARIVDAQIDKLARLALIRGPAATAELLSRLRGPRSDCQ